MRIGAVNVVTKSNNALMAKEQPTFKRQNYAKVFETQYNRKLAIWENVTQMYKVLRDAVINFKGANLSPFFKAEIEENGLLYALMNFTKYTQATPIESFEKIAKKSSKAPYPIAYADDGQPLIQILNHGDYPEQGFFSRLKNGEQRNVNIVFSDLADRSNNLIVFGHQYNTFDIYASRGNVDNPLKKMEVFYNTHNGGRLKQRVQYTGEGNSYNVENFNLDGSKAGESFLDDFRRTVTGW